MQNIQSNQMPIKKINSRNFTSSSSEQLSNIATHILYVYHAIMGAFSGTFFMDCIKKSLYHSSLKSVNTYW
jgi:hypothetical protein